MNSSLHNRAVVFEIAILPRSKHAFTVKLHTFFYYISLYIGYIWWLRFSTQVIEWSKAGLAGTVLAKAQRTNRRLHAAWGATPVGSVHVKSRALAISWLEHSPLVKEPDASGRFRRIRARGSEGSLCSHGDCAFNLTAGGNGLFKANSDTSTGTKRPKFSLKTSFNLLAKAKGRLSTVAHTITDLHALGDFLRDQITRRHCRMSMRFMLATMLWRSSLHLYSFITASHNRIIHEIEHRISSTTSSVDTIYDECLLRIIMTALNHFFLSF